MALMLRKACQSSLNDVDLDAFHADISDDKYLSLYTPCGNHFATVHGVRFATTRPTTDEITFAAELLQTWLKRNAKIINDYLAAFETVERLKDKLLNKQLSRTRTYSPKTVSGSYVDPLDPNKTRYQHKLVGYFVTSKYEEFSFNEHHQVVGWKGQGDPPDSFHRTINTKLDLPVSIVRAARELFEVDKEHRNAVNLMQAIHAELNTCKT